MTTFKDSKLWKKTLGETSPTNENKRHIDTLRKAYESLREKSKILAAQIERDLPDFTVHDISHSDTLWKLADLITGDDYPLTPPEGFVLGGAFLVHDLGMGLAAYPEGIEELKKSTLWSDSIAASLKSRLGRAPNANEITTPDANSRKEATERLLRELHALRAETLGKVSWKNKTTDTEHFLISDTDLRLTYGTLIGKVARSHWLSIDNLNSYLGVVQGAALDFPTDWTVDPLKLACILRTADLAHLDQSRAPSFLYTIKAPDGESAKHWQFQSKLNQPRLNSNRIEYTSNRQFGESEISAWWLCFDVLQHLNRELGQADALLSDVKKPRFRANGVSGTENPERFSRFVETDNWIPVETRIQVSDVGKLVKNLGGENLYGEKNLVPLRELIQNGADAVRARRLLENKPTNWGKIIVRRGKDDFGNWLEIEDTGTGMSLKTLTGSLLDFGRSGWESELIIHEYPSLLSKGFESTGKYGIGFFSVFMWGQRIRVTTRRYDSSISETHQLEFGCGPSDRPTLKRIHTPSQVREGGTVVRVWLTNDFEKYEDGPKIMRILETRLEKICKFVAPTIDVGLFSQQQSEGEICVIQANDWLTIDEITLRKRIELEEPKDHERQEILSIIGKNLRNLANNLGVVQGRAAIVPSHYRFNELSGIITVGGLRSTMLDGIHGILLGDSVTASRMYAVPIVDKDEMARWATEQAILLASSKELSSNEKCDCAEKIRVCRGNVGELPIAFSDEGWLNSTDIVKNFKSISEIFLVQDAAISNLEDRKDFEIKMLKNVIAASSGVDTIVSSPYFYNHESDEWFFNPEPSWENWSFHSLTLQGLVIEHLAIAWNVSIKDIFKVSEKTTDDIKFKRDIGVKFRNNPYPVSVDIIRNPTLYNEKPKP